MRPNADRRMNPNGNAEQKKNEEERATSNDDDDGKEHGAETLGTLTSLDAHPNLQASLGPVGSRRVPDLHAHAKKPNQGHQFTISTTQESAFFLANTKHVFFPGSIALCICIGMALV